MQIRLYLDEDAMDSDLVRALRLRGVDVTTALDTGLTNTADEEQLAYATKQRNRLGLERGPSLYRLHKNIHRPVSFLTTGSR
jgi:uncharacterized protein with PIN domain